MGDLIPFPVDRRREPKERPGDPFAPVYYPGSGTSSEAGVNVEYVRERGWFGVRIRPPLTPA